MTGVPAHPTALSLEGFSPVGRLLRAMCLLENQGVLKVELTHRCSQTLSQPVAAADLLEASPESHQEQFRMG